MFGLKRESAAQKQKPADAKLTSLFDSTADLVSAPPKVETSETKKGTAAKKTSSLFDDDDEGDDGEDFFAKLASIHRG